MISIETLSTNHPPTYHSKGIGRKGEREKGKGGGIDRGRKGRGGGIDRGRKEGGEK
jgi:hypothetical protein